MPKNEDGEFELILGNRQLLSVFFIVVVLLGVFFTMGYIVGRNSPLATAESTPARKTEAKPLVVESAARDESAPVAQLTETPAPAAPDAAPTETAPQQPGDTKPAKSVESKPAAAKPEPVAAKREPPKLAPATEKPEPVTEAVRSAPSGTYLQLAATSQREADIEVDVLRQQGISSAIDGGDSGKAGHVPRPGGAAPGRRDRIRRRPICKAPDFRATRPSGGVLVMRFAGSAGCPQPRLPEWLRKRRTHFESVHDLKAELRRLNLHTVCESARCPNMHECFHRGAATFMILGNLCTRGCGFCSVPKSRASRTRWTPTSRPMSRAWLRRWSCATW